jgi:hypothetical protein
MRSVPIPRRFAPLIWRRPALLWTPLALALAIGWPAGLFFLDGGLRQFALAVGAGVFTLALSTLGASWMLAAAPRARRVVVAHVVIAAALTALAAPFVLAATLSVFPNFTPAMALALAPLALMLALPTAFVSGVAFAWIALAAPRPTTPDPQQVRHEVQPFQ